MTGRTGSPRTLHAAIGVVLFVAMMAGSASAGSNVVPRGSVTDQLRRQVMALMNDTRSNHGLPSFQINRRLSTDALRHTRAMVREGKVFPTPDVAGLVLEYDATLWAEELARGRTLERIVTAWLRHESTRVHLLDRRLKFAAIGAVRANGRFWVTVYLHN